MSSPEDVAMGDDESRGVHEPFTVEENIQQLNDIDKSIAQLMKHTATALNALALPPSTTSAEGTVHSVDPPSQKEAFHSSTDSFLTTLHEVEVRMKRQILALEEAGIINLAGAARQEPGAGAPKAKPSLKPNGMGTVGNLDVGWLNSQGSRVERDMEAELWTKASDFLEKEGRNLRMG